MSIATALNLAIALVEERPSAVRAITKTIPLPDLKGLTSSAQRLNRAVESRIERRLYGELLNVQKTLMVASPETDMTEPEMAAFLEGVAFAERIIDGGLYDLRERLGMDNTE